MDICMILDMDRDILPSGDVWQLWFGSRISGRFRMVHWRSNWDFWQVLMIIIDVIMMIMNSIVLVSSWSHCCPHHFISGYFWHVVMIIIGQNEHHDHDDRDHNNRDHDHNRCPHLSGISGLAVTGKLNHFLLGTFSSLQVAQSTCKFTFM